LESVGFGKNRRGVEMISNLHDINATVEQTRIGDRSLIFRRPGKATNLRQRSKQLKYLILGSMILLGISLLLPVHRLQGAEQSDLAALDNIDAMQAMAIANQWKWTKKEVTSYVNPRGVIFVFPDRKVKGIPLPADKMLVAVAPYIKRTHK
jgi:hypothetical protein